MAQTAVCPAHSVEVLDSATHGSEVGENYSRYHSYSLSLCQTLVLKLHKPKNEKKVQWDEAVVDNEHMNKKKSKCESPTTI